MRFDDGLDTVLAGEIASASGLRSVWLQAVDLIGRRRAGPREAAIARLRAIRDDVPREVRQASARGLERANPPAGLVALFADDAPEVAAPVIRTARLTAQEWLALLPAMSPVTRGVLRHRRDLADDVRTGLEAFGPSDLALPMPEGTGEAVQPEIVWQDGPVTGHADVTTADWFTQALSPEPDAPEPVAIDPEAIPATDAAPDTAVDAAPDTGVADAEPEPPRFVAPEPMPFVALADVARALPIVAEAQRQQAEADAVDVAANDAPPSAPARADLEIASVLSRLEAHRERISAAPVQALPASLPLDRFAFETDAAGAIRWCEGAPRGSLIGLSLIARGDAANADAGVAGAVARRDAFSDGRLTVPGTSAAGGSWRISAVPVFDRASGRFTGYRGEARRPRPDEEPRAAAGMASPGTDLVRQLVHELRTPANAISGFAEMISREMLGPVPAGYRERAHAIEAQAADLIVTIDDLDTAARLESGGLVVRSERTPLQPILSAVVTQLHPLAELRGAFLVLDLAPELAVAGDRVVVERLFSRLLTALVATAGRGERVEGVLLREGDTVVARLSRPAALAVGDGPLFSADAEAEVTAQGGPLLGGGFAFRLARRLAIELGGGIAITAERLTLRLPAAVDERVGQVQV